jgi:hypothetical protein
MLAGDCCRQQQLPASLRAHTAMVTTTSRYTQARLPALPAPATLSAMLHCLCPLMQDSITGCCLAVSCRTCMWSPTCMFTNPSHASSVHALLVQRRGTLLRSSCCSCLSPPSRPAALHLRPPHLQHLLQAHAGAWPAPGRVVGHCPCLVDDPHLRPGAVRAVQVRTISQDAGSCGK